MRERLLALERRITQEAASGAVEGALEELREGLPTVERVATELLNQISALLAQLRAGAELRDGALKKQGGRARLSARGMVRGAAEGLHSAVPQVAEDLRAFAPVLEELSNTVGRGLVNGFRGAIRSPVLALAAAFASGAAVSFTLGRATGLLSRRSRWG